MRWRVPLLRRVRPVHGRVAVGQRRPSIPRARRQCPGRNYEYNPIKAKNTSIEGTAHFEMHTRRTTRHIQNGSFSRSCEAGSSSVNGMRIRTPRTRAWSPISVPEIWSSRIGPAPIKDGSRRPSSSRTSTQRQRPAIRVGWTAIEGQMHGSCPETSAWPCFTTAAARQRTSPP